ncbi:hypothetical protein ACET3Z_010671 [Daucus carota]
MLISPVDRLILLEYLQSLTLASHYILSLLWKVSYLLLPAGLILLLLLYGFLSLLISLSREEDNLFNK